MPTTLIPALRFRDAAAGVDFLSRAFGFTPHLVARGADGAVMHAELVCGDAIVMLGPVADTAFGRLMRQPDEAGGVTQSLYQIVADVDAHCATARAAGAEIVSGPEDQSHGGRVYSCRDPEGHVWSFGSYDPFATPR